MYSFSVNQTVNKGVAQLMRLGVAASRMGGLADRQARAEMRGLQGVLNIEFTGPDGGGWHLAFNDRELRLAKGLVSDPRSTVRVKPQDYLALLAGDLSPSIARMTGKLRVIGDPNLAIAFSASLGNLRALQRARGLRGFVGRRIVGRALRAGSYETPAPKANPEAPETRP